MSAQEDRKQTTPQKQTSVWSVSKRGVRCPSRWSRHAVIRCLHSSLQTLFIYFIFQPQFGQKKDKHMWKETVHFTDCKISFNQFYFHTGGSNTRGIRSLLLVSQLSMTGCPQAANSREVKWHHLTPPLEPPEPFRMKSTSTLRTSCLCQVTIITQWMKHDCLPATPPRQHLHVNVFPHFPGTRPFHLLSLPPPTSSSH